MDDVICLPHPSGSPCKDCGVLRSRYWNGRQCYDCQLAHHRSWARANREKRNAAKRRYRENHPDSVKAEWDRRSIVLKARRAATPRRPSRPRVTLDELVSGILSGDPRFDVTVRRHVCCNHAAMRASGEECLVETGGFPDKNGYRRLKIRRIIISAHRLSWMLWRGPIPDGLVVRHKCDNPPCVNIYHLEIGTPADNANDRVSRGRSARGERCGQARYTEAQVLEVKLLLSKGMSPLEITTFLGVPRHLVEDVRSGRSWSWLIP